MEKKGAGSDMNLRIEYREEMKGLQKDIARMGAIIEKALDNVMKAMRCV